MWHCTVSIAQSLAHMSGRSANGTSGYSVFLILGFCASLSTLLFSLCFCLCLCLSLCLSLFLSLCLSLSLSLSRFLLSFVLPFPDFSRFVADRCQRGNLFRRAGAVATFGSRLRTANVVCPSVCFILCLMYFCLCVHMYMCAVCMVCAVCAHVCCVHGVCWVCCVVYCVCTCVLCVMVCAM